MSRPSALRNLALFASLAFVLVVVGCYGSKFTFIPIEKAKVDPAYVGDWDAVNPKGEHSSLVIRNIDNRMYYVEFRGEGKDDLSRWVGFLAPVKGATFAHVRPIQDDGSVPDEWFIMRLDLRGSDLVIRQLDEKFFEGREIESADQLKHIIEQDLETDAMYDKEETITATRLAKK